MPRCVSRSCFRSTFSGPAQGIRDLLGQLFLTEQRRLGVGLDVGFDELGEFLEPLQFPVVHGDADVADDLLAHLTATAYALDDLHRPPGACSEWF